MSKKIETEGIMHALRWLPKYSGIINYFSTHQ